ncbi:MAG: tail fiber domain-containing protein [Thermoanaerobaculia bacterium]
MRLTYRFSVLFTVLFSFFVFGAPARFVTTNRAIEWTTTSDAEIVLSLQRPDGEVITETFPAGHAPMLRMQDLADGLYSYELRSAQNDVQSGSFTIMNGAVVSPNAIEHRALRPSTPETDTFFTDDVSAQGGVCAGFDCTNAESYGFASAKLKENNTRLKFEDTSTSVGFASTDWQLSANDTTSGGANKFFVEDLTAATVPFLIEGGTPTNTLYVDSNARVGIRTSTPARDLTIDNPVQAGIRMEQSASPFQAWDITASDNQFTIRDVNHEMNPFILKTSAPNNSILVDSAGRIGLGVASPSFQIHHSSGARLDAGNWVNASSRAVKQDIHDLDGAVAMDTLKALQPVTFEYKANPTETNVGFIAEDVPELVATADRKGLSSMDIVAVLTKVIQEQQKTIDELQTRVQRIEQQNH